MNLRKLNIQFSNLRKVLSILCTTWSNVYVISMTTGQLMHNLQEGELYALRWSIFLQTWSCLITVFRICMCTNVRVAILHCCDTVLGHQDDHLIGVSQ